MGINYFISDLKALVNFGKKKYYFIYMKSIIFNYSVQFDRKFGKSFVQFTLKCSAARNTCSSVI